MSSYIMNYFKLAGKGKGLAAGRGEYLTGVGVATFGLIIYFFSLWFISRLSVKEDSALEIISLGVPVLILVIFVVPLVGLIMRRLHDAGYDGKLWLILIPVFLLFGVLVFIAVLAISLLPSKRPNEYLPEDQLASRQVAEISGNKIIGISTSGLLKTLLLFIGVFALGLVGLPLLLIVLAYFVSWLL